ncbi:MAG: LysM peptidoglycan-binding domain-containing protein [Acidobacteria bacterium]|nr:LysM peptidoglycan-binding domain-containing protein [Acidobacteriota bacterium]MCA1651416.1 LysM peptidoglycan-binding domain-containing protein [Acidobacteriota bacterium]
MTLRTSLPGLAVIGLTVLTTACGSNPKRQSPAVTPARPPAPAIVTPAPLPDPIETLIATSQSHFAAGERELKMGHLERARTEFDRAVDVLLESPYGARTDARLREHFDRLVDRVNAYEVTALAQGDGFAEKPSEPASIDEVLKIATFPKPDAEPGTAETVKADLAATEHDVPIPQNSRVLSYVELFQGRLREYIEDGLTRGTKYLPMIQNVFRAEGLPLDLAYIPIIESGFKTNALSRAKAKGPWQFMRATAVEQGLKQNWYIDERSDPEKATVAAAKYLKSLHKLFDGDWHLVLAAYNGGMGRVQRALKRSGRDDFWELSADARYLPRETREYVPLILAAIIVAKNPAQYGFDITPHDPIAYEKVELPRATDLRRVAEWTGATIDDIQALNPELRRWTTPVKYADYAVKVPVGTAALLQARIADAPASDLVALKWYTVKRKDSLASIARKLKVSRADLAEANNLSVKSRVRAGQELVIPRAPATLLAARTERTTPSAVASRAIGGSAPVPASGRAQTSATTYRVKRGDTLSSIARLFDTSVDKIKNWNRLRGNRIAPGDRLKILTSDSQ